MLIKYYQNRDIRIHFLVQVIDLFGKIEITE